MHQSQEQISASIIILNYNGIDDTRACIRSLLPLDKSMEIIVWDNGSEDHQRAALESEFGDQIRAFGSPTNLGITGGNNRAVQHAKGEYIVLLNNDTELTEGWLQPLLDTLKDPSVAIVQPKIRSWYHRDKFDYTGGCGGFLDRYGYPYTRGRLFFTTEEDNGQYDQSMDVEWVSAACMAMKRSLWNEFGGYDDRFFIYMDEIDLCWRLRNNGYRIVCNPASVIYHKGAQTTKRFPFRKVYFEHRNNLLMLVKNLPTIDLLWRLPLRLVLEVISVGYYLIAQGSLRAGGATIKALSGFFWRLIPSLMHRPSAKERVPPSGPNVVWAYFIRGKQYWSQLKNADGPARPVDRSDGQTPKALHAQR